MASNFACVWGWGCGGGIYLNNIWSYGIASCYEHLNPLLSGNPKRGTQTKSADPDQTPHNAASDQGLQCLLTAIFV